MLMQILQQHLKAGALGTTADGKAQAGGDLLASLLQGKHGGEIAQVLTKLGKGDRASDVKLLKGLSPEALSALKQALAQQLLGQQPQGKDGEVGKVFTDVKAADATVKQIAKIVAALKAMSSEGDQGDKAGAQQSPTTKQEDGSSLQVALVAAGVQVEQKPLTKGGLHKQADAGANDGDHDGLLGKKPSAKGKAIAGAAGDEKAASGKGGVDKVVAGQVAAAKRAAGKVAAGQAASDKRDASKVAADHAAANQTATGQAVAGQAQTVAGHAAPVPEAAHPAERGKRVTPSSTPSATTAQSDAVREGGNPSGGHGADEARLAKPKLVTIAKSKRDPAAQDDGVAESMLRSHGSLHTATNADAAGAKAGAQQPTTAQGARPQSGGDHGAQQQGDRSAQGGFDGLLGDLRADGRSTARGAEFATQLGYKSATTWKPADAMLQIGKAAADGSVRLDLQLEPAHLGKVSVSIQSDAAKQVQVHITVDNAAGRAALDQNMGQLRSALAQQGLDLGSFSMNLSSHGRQGQGSDGGSPFARSQRGGFRIESDRVQVESTLPPDAVGTNRAAAGRLSILA